MNSTLGIGPAPGQALVFHVGTAIYAMESLAVNREEMPLDDRKPLSSQMALADSERLLEVHTHGRGNFYTP